MTFQKGLGAVHSLSHPLGGLKEPRLHHGTLNAVLLPEVLRFNAEGAEAKYAALAHAMDVADPAGLPSAIVALNADLGLPSTLSEMGVPRQVLPSIADNAVLDHSTASNARPIGRDDFLAILEKSWG